MSGRHLMWYNVDEKSETRDHDRAHEFWGIILTSWTIEQVEELTQVANNPQWWE